MGNLTRECVNYPFSRPNIREKKIKPRIKRMMKTIPAIVIP